MDNITFKLLKRKYFHNEDSNKLASCKQKSSPYVASKIDLILGNPRFMDPNRALDVTKFTTHFRDAPSKERLNEVVATYLLFLANTVCLQKYSRPFIRPGRWEGDSCWQQMYKMVVFSVLTLLYDIRWKSEYFMFLDEALMGLLQGKSEALRSFVEKLGIHFQDSIEAEHVYPYLEYQNNRIFGPYYWRLLHWMAEAIAFRSNNGNSDVVLAKNLWREFVTNTLHRTLQCGICIHHYKMTINETHFKDLLMHAKDEEYPKVWFDLHNKVNDLVFSPRYSESELEKDRTYLRSAL